MSAAPKAALCKQIMAEVMGEAVRALVEFSCPPHPVHGEKPMQFVRANAAKAWAGMESTLASDVAAPAPSGGGMRARMEAKAAEMRARAEEMAVSTAAAAQQAAQQASEAASAAAEAAKAPKSSGWTPLPEAEAEKVRAEQVAQQELAQLSPSELMAKQVTSCHCQVCWTKLLSLHSDDCCMCVETRLAG